MTTRCAICGTRLEDDGQICGNETNGGFVCYDPLDCCDELRARAESLQKYFERVSDLNERMGKHISAWEDAIKEFCAKHGVEPEIEYLTPYTVGTMLERVVENAKSTSSLERHMLLSRYWQADLNGTVEEQYASLKEMAAQMARDLYVATEALADLAAFGAILPQDRNWEQLTVEWISATIANGIEAKVRLEKIEQDGFHFCAARGGAPIDYAAAYCSLCKGECDGCPRSQDAEKLADELRGTISLLRRVSSEGCLGWWDGGLLEQAEETLSIYRKKGAASP